MDDEERIATATGARPRALDAVVGHGAPSHRRWRVTYDDRPPAFAKIAAFDYTADWLRTEHANYEALAGQPYLSPVLGWHDDGEHPALVIEDLSDAIWPPPWTTERIDAVLEALSAIQATPPPASIADEFGALFDIHEGWDPMRADPSGALGLGVFDRVVVRDARRRACRGRRVSRPRRRRPAARRRAERQPVLPRRPGRARRLELGLPRRLDARRVVVAAEPEPRRRSRTVGTDAGQRAARRAPRRVLPRARRAGTDPPGAARPAAAAGSRGGRSAMGLPRAGHPGRPTPPDIAPATRCYNRPRWPSPPPTTQTCSTCSAAGACA